MRHGGFVGAPAAIFGGRRPERRPENVSRQRTPPSSPSAPRPKVVVVSPAHPSYDDVRVFQKEARTLAHHGYDVTLYAQAPGRLGPFAHDAIRVVPLEVNSRTSLVLHLPQLTRRLLAEDAAVYHCHNPFTLPLVFALKAAGRRVIYDVHEDYWERVRIRPWIPRPLRTLTGLGVVALEHVAARIADAAGDTQEDVRARLGPRALLIDNAPIVDGALMEAAAAFGAALSDDEVHPGGALRLVYAGGLSVSRGLLSMVDTVERLQATGPARLWLLGHDDPASLAQARARPGWAHVDFLGPRPQHEAFGYITRADVGLAVLLDEGGHRFISSNKLYEYMALGTPFVASNFARWRERLPTGSGGLFVDPTDPEAIARAVLHLAAHPEEAQALTERGRLFVREAFNWERDQAKQLARYDPLGRAAG